METFKKKGIRIQNNTIQQIKEEYRSLINHYRNIFINQIVELIQSEIRGIPEYKIEEWIDDNLITEMRTEGNHQINRIGISLEENFSLMCQSINPNTDIPLTQHQYEEELNKMTRNLNFYWLEEIINNLRREIIRKLEYYYDPFSGISDYRFKRNLENIEDELRPTLTKLSERFMEEYEQIIKTEFNKNKEQICINLENINMKEKLTNEDIQRYTNYLQFSGYDLIQENDKLYARYKKTDQIIELRYSKEDDRLTDDKGLAFQIRDDEFTSVDKYNDLIIATTSNSIYTSNIKQKYAIRIVENFMGYDFYYNSKKTTNPSEIIAIIDRLKTKLPLYYNKLMKDQEFKKIVEKTEKHEEEIKEIYTDKLDGKVKVNPLTREKVTQKLRIFGYELLANDDGLSVKDLKTGEEHKIICKNSKCYLEGINPMQLNFYTNVTIRTPNIIFPNRIEFTNGNKLLIANDNLSSLDIYIGDIQYQIELKDKLISCIAKDKNGKNIPMSNKEIISNLQKEFPYLIEYMQNKIKEPDQELSSPKTSEEKSILEIAKETLLQGQTDQKNLQSSSPKR